MVYQDEWKFAGEAYNGEGGFADAEVLEQFSRESDDRFGERKDSSKREYENIFVSKVSRYVGYLYKQPPVRVTNSDVLGAIVNNIDRSGNTVDVFMSSFTKNAKVRGVNLMLIDETQDSAIDRKDQIDNQLLPYVVEILPERVTDYKIDAFGKFEYVAFSDVINESTYREEKKLEVIRYYDKEEWRVYDGDEIIDSGPHGLGVCPVLIFAEKGKFESTGEFTQIAGMSKKLFNLDSELKLLLRGQTFSILTIHSDKGAKPDIELGTNNALIYSGDKAPSFISSDVGQPKTYAEKIEETKASMDRVAYDVSGSNGRETAEALSIKFQSLNSSLNSFAQRVEDIERSAWNIICAKLQVNPEDISLFYNMDFDIIDIEKEISTLDSINSIVDLPLYRATKLKSIIKADLPSVDQEGMDALFMEVDNQAKESEVEVDAV